MHLANLIKGCSGFLINLAAEINKPQLLRKNFKQMKKLTILLLLPAFIFFGCTTNQEKKEDKEKNRL